EPVVEGLGSDPEATCGLLDRDEVGAHVAEDAETGFGRVVGAAAGVDRVEPRGEDAGAVLGLAAPDLALLELGEERGLRIRLIAHAGEGDERAKGEVTACG